MVMLVKETTHLNHVVLLPVGVYKPNIAFVSNETAREKKLFYIHTRYYCIMKSVYVFGPIHLFGQDYLPVYKKVDKLCEKYFDKVIGTYPDFWDSKETPREFYDRTIKTIVKCDLFISEVSSPSLGVGMELQMAYYHKIPIIALAKEGIPISVMVLGIPNLLKVVRYKDIDDLMEKLDKELKTFSEPHQPSHFSKTR